MAGIFATVTTTQSVPPLPPEWPDETQTTPHTELLTTRHIQQTSKNNMSSTALATTSTATSTSRTAAGTSSPLPLRKDATQTPRTPQRQTGQWTHPRMDEVIRRRNATNFDSSNVTTILLSAGLIVLSLFTPTVLYHTCVSNPVSPSALLPHSRTILQNPYPMARSSLPIPALRRLDLPNPHAPQHPHRHTPPLAETRLL